MSERRKILAIVVVTLFIGIIGLSLILGLTGNIGGGDVYVEDYTATLYPNGTLVEVFKYRINKANYRFLYRNWEVPLSKTSLNNPYIEPLSINPVPGAQGYFTNYQGQVEVQPYSTIAYITILDLSLNNEIGSYNDNYYDTGLHTVSYVYLLHPPIEYDDEAAHLNLKLATEHLPYSKVTIILEDADYIQDVYPHPPSYTVEQSGDRIIITGSSNEDELIEIELLMNLETVDHYDGFPSRIEGVTSKTVDANSMTTIQYQAASIFYTLVPGLVILMPFIIYYIYVRHGKEKEYTVPSYLSYVPNNERRPWLVNQIFKGGVFDYDDEGFYATLLDLNLRGNIDIESKPGGDIPF